MQLIVLLSLILLTNSAPLFTNTKDQTIQSIYEIGDDLYIYTYENSTTNIYKLYRFTTEEIITCFTNTVTVDSTNYVYINIVLLSFSVQFDYTDTDTDEIAMCTTFQTDGIFTPTNYNERRFHNNMLNYGSFYLNFHKNMLQTYEDNYTFDDTSLENDHVLIQNEQFLDQTQTLDETLDIDKYHILSSHNSYLEDNEYFGLSVSERALVRQFYLGIRCVELDIWPVDQPAGSTFNVYVSVQHKYSSLETNKIDLKSTLKIINKYGFIVDDSPIIITFENHLFTVNEYKYFINSLEESGLTFLMASDLNDVNIYQYQNLKDTVIIRMNFSDDDKDLNVTPEASSIQNEGLNNLYKGQYIQNPLTQFWNGFSYLSYMTDQIFLVTQTEMDQIQQNDDVNTMILKNESHQKRLKQSDSIQPEKPVNADFRGVSSISGNYYTTNEALEYVSMTRDCYPDVNNIIWFSFEENVKYKNTIKDIESIDNDSSCKYMTRIYTGFYRILSGNYNPLDGIALGVNILALNAQNIDKNMHDYVNYFTTRNGYRVIDTISQSDKKKYKIQIDEVYIPKQLSLYYMSIRYYRKDKKYQKSKKVKSKFLVIRDGRNTRKLKDYKFKARDEDFLYIQVGFQYRYSVMIKDMFISGQTEIDNGTYQIAILRSLKNYYWDGAFIKLRILDNS